MAVNREPGILPESSISFHVPSAFARDTLYYAEMGGDYVCDERFVIERETFHTFIMFWVKAGSLHVSYQGKDFSLLEGQLLLIDAKLPHFYQATPGVAFEWFHFAGAGTQHYFDLLAEDGDLVFDSADVPAALTAFRQVMNMLREDAMNEHRMSVCLHSMLGELASPGLAAARNCDSSVRDAIRYINAHFAEDLTLERIASRVNLSPFHFARLFKKNTNSTPHEFVLNTRIKHAKQMLLESAHSIEYIASECGFNSPSHFIRAFKKETQLTPKQFRTTQF
ncbi:helix-turn-helix domain-containing protein [Intestinibacillus massiliensis]